jgi:methylglutaconyl-CoA hydratase
MILVEQGPGVLTLALNRPSGKNALDLGMVRDLRRALGNLEPSTRVIVLRSVVDGYFSVGMDLVALDAGIQGGATPAEVTAATAEYVGLLKDLTQVRAITIAEVAGMAVGGGVDLLSSCDLALCSDRAAFSIAQLRKGIFPLTTSGVVIPRIGQREFLFWMLSGQSYSAMKARRLGLVSQVVPHAELSSRVDALVERTLSYDEGALRLGIEALRVGPNLTPSDRLDHLGALLSLNCQSRPRGRS